MNFYKKTFWLMGLPLLCLLAGCTTPVSYKSNLKAGEPKPSDYPIAFYSQEMHVPRPSEVVGTVTIGANGFHMGGGSLDDAVRLAIEKAREKGADAVQLVSTKEPDFSNTSYRIVAKLLRYTDTWKTVSFSQEQFMAYLRASEGHLDPVEGIWVAKGSNPHWVGIMRDLSKPGRQFVGFILGSQNPAWQPGYVKMTLKHADQPGYYSMTYYLSDFSRRDATFYLGHERTFSLIIQNSGESSIITYAKK